MVKKCPEIRIFLKLNLEFDQNFPKMSVMAYHKRLRLESVQTPTILTLGLHTNNLEKNSIQIPY